jgi:phospholipase D1/2
MTSEHTVIGEDHHHRSLKDVVTHPFPHLRQKFKHSHGLYNAKVKAVHVKNKLGKFHNLINHNHRHDEEHEKETDRKRSAIAESHRFNSFAPEREGNLVKWYIDGRDYFWVGSAHGDRTVCGRGLTHLNRRSQ